MEKIRLIPTDSTEAEEFYVLLNRPDSAARCIFW